MNNPVAPVEGHYALLRNGSVVGPMRAKNDGEDCFDAADCEGWDWRSCGGVFTDGCHSHDIIATIAPEAMQAAASGELERLRAALNDIFEMWAGSEGFIPHTAPEGYLLMLVKKMAVRAALAKGESK